ncbi:hypothetical protein CR155_09285 [Pollutimonas nitritireducens]|uniref:Tetratricopeptide repeat protein n=1 Tax=Pollutimonas nitritireducens TaxID=2045209 RepID=A0A2N4UH16_9BURK|nr:tetratricopeptide repeat protein [Pollutimonas nitritireducens]PLC54290.1 hypothetical protein CR155_09285 [Pollutimonas nitritireducens]
MVGYFLLRLFTAAFLAAASFTYSAYAASAPVELDEGIRSLQNEWALIQYKTPEKRRAARFETLSQRAHELTTRHTAHAEPHIWEGIILGSWAGAKGGLGALSLAKRSKAEYETAIQIDSMALDGSALSSLGVLYYRVPGWPVGFGDNKKAEALLRQALAVNPDGIDSNFFYADFLVSRNREKEALEYVEKALKAPPRPGRKVADEGRRDEAQLLLKRIQSKADAPSQ